MRVRLILFVLFICLSMVFGQFKDSYSPEKEFKFPAQLDITSDVDKSKTLAFVFSLLIPGLGEYYLGQFNKGKYFTIAEGTLWLSLFGFDYYGRWQRNNYVNYAKLTAGVNPYGKDERFWANVGLYMNIDDFNQEKLLFRNFEGVYNEETHFWSWNTNEERKKYRNLWLASEHAFNNKRFPAALIVVNHLASAINSLLLAGRINQSNENSVIISPQFGIDNFQNPSFQIEIIKLF